MKKGIDNLSDIGYDIKMMNDQQSIEKKYEWILAKEKLLKETRGLVAKWEKTGLFDFVKKEKEKA